jgi:CRP-like cAMP-binding protein
MTDEPADILLRKLTKHSRVDAEDIAALQRLNFRSRAFAPDEDIVHQGDKPEISVLVLNGMVARYHTRAGGKRQYLSFHMTGELPDAQTLFLEQMDHSVCALGNAEIATVSHQELCSMFEGRPALAFAVWRETLIDAAIFREAITNNSNRPVLPRMAHLFCELYYRARAIGIAKPGSFAIPLHQGQIGETLGLSIVTVNRTLQMLRTTGTMDFRNGLLMVHDWKRLSATAEFDPGYLHLKKPGRM